MKKNVFANVGKMTKPEQEEMLRKMMSPGSLDGWARIGKMSFLAIVGIMVLGMLVTRSFGMLPFLAFVFLAFFGISTSLKKMLPLARNALSALDSSHRMKGVAHVKVDEDSDGDKKYVMSVTDSSGSACNFKFAPHGWEPVSGDHEVELRFVPESQWPALVEFDAGFAFPLEQPSFGGSPRESKRTASSPFAVFILGVLFFFGSGGLAVLVGYAHFENKKVDDEWMPTNAKVIVVEPNGLGYEFVDGKTGVTFRRSIPKSASVDGERISPGMSISVRYDPKSPQSSLLASEKIAPLEGGLSVFLLVIAAFGALLGMAFISGAFRSGSHKKVEL